eukprot:CAMPEP_0206235370 /NCGR_PEP_ID=MMETSP0047_2-20121206/13111_1 /ASSEMBLY_ACC=CAM_ASM_000192 /TAXON_ID=195065 /ORGANISM="Chroomonas mesostigmatica_cf, Strain CCMP1168" /LENGTH=179 /DNA_ID=CAMNT_0053659565 /DNA_START=251 /DNA_END=790 /DNA_ORIENTATION=-
MRGNTGNQLLLGLVLLGCYGAHGFQVYAHDNGLPSLGSITRDLQASAKDAGPSLPPPLKRRGAERTLLYPSAQALYEEGKEASREARRQAKIAAATTFTRTSEYPDKEEKVLMAKDRWAGVRNFVRNTRQFKVTNRVLKENPDDVAQRLFEEAQARKVYEEARLEELDNETKRWQELGP